MSDLQFPLLRTKLHQPLPAPSLVPRERLLKILLDRPETRVVLVVASAGSGKTTLLVQWLEHLTWPVAWLSLDENDDDLVVFLSYLTAAIQTAFPEACSLTQKLITTPQPPPADYLAATLANELSEISEPFVLVLDDYHHIHSVTVHDAIGQLLRHMPPSLHLVISSRYDPPLPLSLLASRGTLLEIRAADLRFRPAEAQVLLARVAGATLSDARVDALVEELDGWAVGLQSVAISLRQGDNWRQHSARAPAADYRQLTGILANEVFAAQPAPVREFLLRTSLLNQLTAPLCQVLLGGLGAGAAVPVNSKALLQQIERDSLFVEILDENHQWYRYHNLFRSFLARKLEQSYNQNEIATLHRRASTWYWEQGSADEAIRHALAAQDSSLAADIVEAWLHAILNREEWPVLERWLGLLPGEILQRRPLLLVAHAWVLYFNFKLHALPPVLAQAEELLAQWPTPDASSARVRGDIEALHSLLFYAAGDYPRAITSAQCILSSREPGHTFGRSFSVLFLIMSAYAMQGEEQATSLCSKIVDDPLEQASVKARAVMSLGHIYGIACRPVEQKRAAHALLRLTQEHDLDVSAAWAHRHLGNASYESYELEAAVHHYSLGVDQRYLAHFACARDCYVGLALTYQAQGRTDDANATAAALQAFYVERGFASLPELDSFLARLAFLNGDTHRALHILERGRQGSASLAMVAYETASLTQAMVHIVAGTTAQRRQAMADLGRLQALAEASRATWHLIRILALQAIAFDLEGQTEAALVALQRTVVLGRPGQVVASFVELGAPIQRLLQRLAERDVEPVYVRHLLAAFPAQPAAGPAQVAGGAGGLAAQASLVEPLSPREMEVLALLNRRLSNKEIAAALVVSPLTVKRHLTNILQKLGVDSRWEAVERAREIGLIPPA